MNRFSIVKDSLCSPLLIASLQLGDGEGCLGLTICPGKKDSYKWNRDLEEDLRAIRNWGASTVVTLIEPEEFNLLKVNHLGEKIVIHCRGGLGRTGVVAGLILVERGCAPNDAIRRVRSIRPGAIETVEQEKYVLKAKALTPGESHE